MLAKQDPVRQWLYGTRFWCLMNNTKVVIIVPCTVPHRLQTWFEWSSERLLSQVVSAVELPQCCAKPYHNDSFVQDCGPCFPFNRTNNKTGSNSVFRPHWVQVVAYCRRPPARPASTLSARLPLSCPRWPPSTPRWYPSWASRPCQEQWCQQLRESWCLRPRWQAAQHSCLPRPS